MYYTIRRSIFLMEADSRAQMTGFFFLQMWLSEAFFRPVLSRIDYFDVLRETKIINFKMKEVKFNFHGEILRLVLKNLYMNHVLSQWKCCEKYVEDFWVRTS